MAIGDIQEYYKYKTQEMRVIGSPLNKLPNKGLVLLDEHVMEYGLAQEWGPILKYADKLKPEERQDFVRNHVRSYGGHICLAGPYPDWGVLYEEDDIWF